MRISGLLLLIMPLCAHPLLAQDASQNTAQTAPYEVASAAEPSSPIVTDPSRPLASSFEPGAAEEYTIGAGDEIHIDVSGRSELTGDYTLGPDGRITIPSVGSVDLEGLTREQAADAVKHAMDPFYTNPYVTVGVVHYLSNNIILLGNVKNPGLQNFDDAPTLLQALSRAGIGAETGVGNTTTGNVATMPDRAYVYRGSQEVAVVDIKKLLSGGAMSDLRLRRGDVVMVPVENQLICSRRGQKSGCDSLCR